MLRQSVPDVSARSELARPPLWMLAVLFFGIGDLITTTVGVNSAGIVEGGPVTALLVERYGLRAIFHLKVLVIGSGYVAWRVIPQPQRVGIPLALVLVGVFATAWNLHILALAFLS